MQQQVGIKTFYRSLFAAVNLWMCNLDKRTLFVPEPISYGFLFVLLESCVDWGERWKGPRCCATVLTLSCRKRFWVPTGFYEWLHLVLWSSEAEFVPGDRMRAHKTHTDIVHVKTLQNNIAFYPPCCRVAVVLYIIRFIFQTNYMYIQ